MLSAVEITVAWQSIMRGASRLAALAALMAMAVAMVSAGADAQGSPDGQVKDKPPGRQTVEPKASMRFELIREGPDEACGKNCREWISASGPIVVETGRDFEAFAKKHNLQGQVMVLESGGGSVAGGIALGRAIRRLNMTVTVGSTRILSGLPRTDAGQLRASYSPKAGCASMCPFVLLGGVRRHVPPESRISVHQIWPSSMRADATASDYTAQSVVGLLRSSAEMARYSIEMGADIELFEVAMRIPPWETLRVLTQAEILRMRLHNHNAPFEASGTVQPPAKPQSAPPVTGGKPPADAPGNRWALVGRGSDRGIARNHPITVEGITIGTFVFTFGCGFTPAMLSVLYSENRRIANAARVDAVEGVQVLIGGERVELKVESSRAVAGRLETLARGIIGLGPVTKVLENDRQSFSVTTLTEAKARTAIRIGNTGLAVAMPQLTMACMVGLK